MVRKISVSDITMKESGANGHSLSFREKIELSKLLDKLGVSVIETNPIVNRKPDSLLVKSLASAISNSVLALPVNIEDKDGVEVAWNALKVAKNPRLQVSLPVSTVQMEYICHKKPDAIVQMIQDLVKQCRELCQDVEFIAEDAGRSDEDFLKKAIEAAAQAGATVVTICDTAGNLLPDEFISSVKSAREALPENVKLGVRCANDMFMADTCSIFAAREGADEIKVIAAGKSTASLENVATILAYKQDNLDATSDVRVTEIRRAVKQIQWMCETSRSKLTPFNGAQEQITEVVLGSHETVEAVSAAVKSLGYDLSEEDTQKVFESYQRLAANGQVGGKELDAIVASVAYQVPPTYVLDSYVINSGNAITATCHMRLKKEGILQESVCLGDGPVDAAFQAIESVIGCHYELDDFQIQSVTEGREAMGEAVIRLRNAGKIYSGRGISTDIVGSSIMAYLNAVNKIVYEEVEA